MLLIVIHIELLLDTVCHQTVMLLVAVMLIRDDLPRDHRLKLRNGPSLGRVCHKVVMLLVSRHAYWG